MRFPKQYLKADRSNSLYLSANHNLAYFRALLASLIFNFLLNREEKSLHHVTVVGKILDLNKPEKKKTLYDFPVHDYTQK